MTSDTWLIDAIEGFYSGRPPYRLGVAVSGGADSLALLHLLHELGLSELHAVTVNHGLRPESASEALHVERICNDLGIPHAILEWQGWDGKGNLQDQARRTRYALMAEWGRAEGIEAVALGHTMDDQAETFLMQLARKAGVDGLSSMAPRIERHGMDFDRPLLFDGRRRDLRNYLEHRGVRWVDDPSNENEAFERVKARNALMHLEPLGISVPGLSDVAQFLSSARTALDFAARERADQIAKIEAGDIVFDRAALRRPPSETKTRLLSKALQWVASADYPPRRGPLTEVEVAVGREENTTLHGCRVLVSQMTVRITRELAAVADCRCPTRETWDTRWRFDGPHAPDLEIRALGEAVRDCPDWRQTGLPRATLLASPAIWRGETLIAAPLAGLHNGWTATTPGKEAFIAFLVSH